MEIVPRPLYSCSCTRETRAQQRRMSQSEDMETEVGMGHWDAARAKWRKGEELPGKVQVKENFQISRRKIMITKKRRRPAIHMVIHNGHSSFHLHTVTINISSRSSVSSRPLFISQPPPPSITIFATLLPHSSVTAKLLLLSAFRHRPLLLLHPLLCCCPFSSSQVAVFVPFSTTCAAELPPLFSLELQLFRFPVVAAELLDSPPSCCYCLLRAATVLRVVLLEPLELLPL
ncbi:hypothetical protein CRG98_030758 [Punica granatum]|uniref:Uncharacterized protein n=1 Tax=Punica granatum TaxID=22663 RepID=A0A2I0IYS7_PUNGR|nr:hypothetical protein CRG98_030758 [Punica granatum]